MENNYSNPLLALSKSDWLPALKLLCSAGLILKKDWEERNPNDSSVFSSLIEKNNSADATKFLLDMGCNPFGLSKGYSFGSVLIMPDLFKIWAPCHQEMVLTVLQNTTDEKLKEQHKKYNFFGYALRYGHFGVIEHLAERDGLNWESEDTNFDQNINNIELAGAWQKINDKYGKVRTSAALAADVVYHLSERSFNDKKANIIKNTAILLKNNEAIWTPLDINNILTIAVTTPNRGALALFTKALNINWAQYAPPKGEEHPIKKAISHVKLTEVCWFLNKGVSLIETDKSGHPLMASLVDLKLFHRGYKPSVRKAKDKIIDHLKKVFLRYPEKFGENTLYDAMIKAVVDRKASIWELDFEEWLTLPVALKPPSFWWKSLANGEIRLETLLKIKKDKAPIFVIDKLLLGLKDQDPEKIMTVFKSIINFAASLEGDDEMLKVIEKSLLPALSIFPEKITWDNWSEYSVNNAKILCAGDAKNLGNLIWKEVAARRLLSVIDHVAPLIKKSHRI